MSQFANNQEGSFEFPSGAARSFQTPIVPPSLPVSGSAQGIEGLSQAELDRIKAEELIASFSDGPIEESTFISTADDVDLQPGDFAAADPYVNSEETTPAVYDVAAGEPKPVGLENSVPSNSNERISKLTKADDKSIRQSRPVDTNLSSSPADRVEANARTIDEILSSIPGYESAAESDSSPLEAVPENRPNSDSTLEGGVETVSAQKELGSSAALQRATEVDVDDSQVSAGQVSLSTGTLGASEELKTPVVELTTPIGLPKNVDGDLEEVPVSWFVDKAPQESAVAPIENGTIGTAEGADSIGTSPLSAIVDPDSGVAEFDVRDFSEMAELKIQPIPNAYSEATATEFEQDIATSAQGASSQLSAAVDEETILSPLGQNSDQEIPAPSSEPKQNFVEPAIESPALKEEPALSVSPLKADFPEKPIPVTTIIPVDQQASVVPAPATEDLASNSAVSGSASSAPASGSVPSLTGSEAAADLSAATVAAALSSLLKPTAEINSSQAKFAKSPPPAPTIDDSEIAAALEKCGDIPEPVPEYGVPEFSDETFDEPEIIAQPKQELERKSDDTFLVDEGEVILIDGNDGYEFIDLACFERSAATVEQGRIIIEDDNSAAFEVHYKNIDYVLFAGEVTVDLPPVAS